MPLGSLVIDVTLATRRTAMTLNFVWLLNYGSMQWVAMHYDGNKKSLPSKILDRGNMRPDDDTTCAIGRKTGWSQHRPREAESQVVVII